MNAPHRFYLFASLLLSLASLSACGSDSPADPECTEGEDCPQQALGSVRLTYLDVQYDLSEPIFINNRVPLEYGLTATEGETDLAQVAVSFSFVEAEPVDPEAPIECSSNASVVELEADGEEHRYFGYVWPTTVCDELLGRQVNIRVAFDGGEEVETEVDAPSVSFTEAERNEPLNQLCVTATGDVGCVYAIDLQPTPTDDSGITLIDVLHGSMESGSSVGVLPLEGIAPLISVESVLTVNGRDPYVAAVAPEEIPADLLEEEPELEEDLQFGLDAEEAEELLAMPGPATLRYELRPVGTEETYLPLTIGTTDARTETTPVTSLLPGTANVFAHELFAEGGTRTALAPGGTWGELSDFELRGCFEAEFEQVGNEGSYDATADDCRSIEIVLVRETDGAVSAAIAHELSARLERSIGGSRLGLESALETENRLDSNGVFSRVEGNVSIQGNIGRSFTLDIVRARAQASAGPDPLANGYEASLTAFGETVFEVSDSGGEITREEEFSVGKSFNIGNLGFGFGPVRIGIAISVGGELGIGLEDRLFTTTDPEVCGPIFEGQSFAACGQIGRTTTPFFAFTALVEGGVRIGPVSGGVEADLRIINTEFPLDTALSFGIADDGGVSVAGSANWNLNLTLISGDVNIVGRIRFRRRFLRRFNRTLRVNLFSFSSPTIERNLLERTVELEVLQ